jgi:hypothetical protein
MQQELRIAPTRFGGTYTKVSGRIGKLVDGLLGVPVEQQISLHEELAVARASLAETIEAYEQITTGEAGEVKPGNVLIAGKVVREAVKAVAYVAQKAAVVEVSKDIKPTFVTALAMSLEQSINNTVTDPVMRSLLIDRVESAFHGLATKVANANSPDVLSPYETALAMDMTVPRAPEPAPDPTVILYAPEQM